VALQPDGKFQPALSQTGVAMGSYLGRALVRQAEGKTVPRFQFHAAGYIISLGKHSSVLELFGVPVAGKLAWLLWAGAYLIKMVGFRKQIEVGLDHVLHFFFEHDTSQIMNRRQILSDEELNLSLSSPGPNAGVANRDPRE
jgi:NADH dehydrogenase FAD-containing subunit